ARVSLRGEEVPGWPPTAGCLPAESQNPLSTHSGHHVSFTASLVIDVAVDLVIVVKCKMVLWPIGLVASWPTIACFSWTVTTASCTHAISILAMTWKPFT